MITPSWIGNTWITILILIIVFIFFVSVLNSASVAKCKKYIDFTIVCIGALGIFGLNADIRQKFAKNDIRHFSNVANKSTYSIEHFLKRSSECVPRTKNKFPPANFDKIEDARKDMCAWKKKAYNLFQRQDFSSFPKLPALLVDEFPETSRKYFEHEYIEHKKAINEYDEFLNEVKIVEKRIRHHPFEQILRVFSPYLLAIAFGLSAAKIIRE